MTSNVLPIVIIAVFVIFGLYLFGNQASLDIAGPLRSWLWEREARKMKERDEYPASITRAYWSRLEYDKDAARLRALGYEVASENETGGYVKLPDVELRRGRELPRRRIPSYFVIYERRARET